MEYNYEKIYDIMTKFQQYQYNIASVLGAMQFLCGNENLAKYICLNWKTEKDNLLSKCRDKDKYLIEHFREKCNDTKFKEIKNLVSEYCCKNKYLCDINIVSILLHNLK